eukprot:757981-Hanusia_phi.AAC.5
MQGGFCLFARKKREIRISTPRTSGHRDFSISKLPQVNVHICPMPLLSQSVMLPSSPSLPASTSLAGLLRRPEHGCDLAAVHARNLQPRSATHGEFYVDSPAMTGLSSCSSCLSFSLVFPAVVKEYVHKRCIGEREQG